MIVTPLTRLMPHNDDLSNLLPFFVKTPRVYVSKNTQGMHFSLRSRFSTPPLCSSSICLTMTLHQLHTPIAPHSLTLKLAAAALWLQAGGGLLWFLAAAAYSPSSTMAMAHAVPSARLLLQETSGHGDVERRLHENQPPLRMKLERIPGPAGIDRFEALRRAMHRDGARRQRGRQQLEISAAPRGASLNVISGSSVGSGEYLASISVGTPPQKLFLIADTGSDLTWVKCHSSSSPSSASSSPSAAIARRAGHVPTNQSFDASASFSFSPLACLSSECKAWSPPAPPSAAVCRSPAQACAFSFSYTDHSSSAGHLAFESLTLGDTITNVEQADRIVIGCGRRYAGPNIDKAGGVLGLGQGRLSLASQLAARSAYSNKFSYCLADFFGSAAIAGSLAFGESFLQTMPSSLMKYTPLIQNPYAETFYYVGVQAVKVGDIELDIPAEVWAIDEHGNGGTIVDSGTTLAQFAQPAYDAIREAFRMAIRDMAPLEEQTIPGLDLCYSADRNTTAFFPGFAIAFEGGLVMEPPVENYFTEAAPGVTCLAMQAVRSGSFSVVGNLLQQNFHVEFDRLHKRLGVSPVDCSKLHS